MLAYLRTYKLIIAAFLGLVVVLYGNNYNSHIAKTTSIEYAKQALDIAHHANSMFFAKHSESKQVPSKIIKSVLDKALFYTLIQSQLYNIAELANIVKNPFNKDSFLHHICVLII